MGDLNPETIDQLINGKPRRVSDGNGLYLIKPIRGRCYWATRYTFKGKRRLFKLEAYEEMGLSKARAANLEIQALIKSNLDPLTLKDRDTQQAQFNNVDDLFQQWYIEDIVSTHVHHHIPKRLYLREASPFIGNLPVHEVTENDINVIIDAIHESGRSSIAKDVFRYLKRMLDYAEARNLIENNPIKHLKYTNTGEVAPNKDRLLTLTEIETIFRVMRQYRSNFTLENYLACCLLLVLGVRKTELFLAQWQEFDLDKGVWNVPIRYKNSKELLIPLPTQAVNWLSILKVKALDSEYVFPARQQKKNPYVSHDTLYAALNYLMGADSRRKTPNRLPGIKPFTINDLRLTFKSLAEQLNVERPVIEKCLNRHHGERDYFKQRRVAHQRVADLLDKFL